MAVVDRWHRRNKETGKKERTSRYGKGKRWSAQWSYPDGTRDSASFTNRDEAQEFLQDMLSSIRRGTYIDPSKAKITFQEYAEEWLRNADHAAVTSRQMPGRLERHVYPHFGHLQLSAITPSVIRAWLKALKHTKSARHNPDLHDWVPPLSGSYQYLLFVNVNTILNAAVGDEYLIKNPMNHSSVRRPKKDTAAAEPWPDDRVAEVTKHLPPRWRIIPILALGCGLRGGEAMGLDPYTDIDWKNLVLHVRRQTQYLKGGSRIFKLPKYDKVRWVPLPEPVAAAIRRHMEQYPPQKVTLPWGNEHGEPTSCRLLVTTELVQAMTSKTFTQTFWNKACIAAGYQPVPNHDGLHVLRHTFTSKLLHGGESIVTVSEWLGHATPAITYKVYSHMLPEGEARSRSILEEFFKQEGMPSFE